MNLIYNAELVLSTSFHGTVFSISLNKHFLTIDGDKDARISNVLKIVDLEENVVNISNFEEKLKICLNTNFGSVNYKLSCARKSSINYLKKALGIKENGDL